MNTSELTPSPPIIDEHNEQRTHSFWQSFSMPLLMLIFAILIEAYAHGSSSLVQWNALVAVHKNQEAQIQASTKIRAQLDALARETAILAKNGNVNAKVVVDELQKRGISIDVNAIPLQTSTNSINNSTK
jgi:hypothetical protein